MTIAFRILRLARPNLVRIDTTPLVLDLWNGQNDSREGGDNSSHKYAHRVQLEHPTDGAGLSPTLVLPSSRTTLYLGENLSAYITLGNGGGAPVSAVAVKVELSTAGGASWVLYDNSKNPLPTLIPGGRHDIIVQHDIKDLGLHTIACSAVYTDLDDKRNYHVQFFKLTGASPLAVRTKVRTAPNTCPIQPLASPSLSSSMPPCGNEQGKDCSSGRALKYFLEVAIMNSMPSPMLLDSVELQPAWPGIRCRKLLPPPCHAPVDAGGWAAAKSAPAAAETAGAATAAAAGFPEADGWPAAGVAAAPDNGGNTGGTFPADALCTSREGRGDQQQQQQQQDGSALNGLAGAGGAGSKHQGLDVGLNGAVTAAANDTDLVRDAQSGAAAAAAAAAGPRKQHQAQPARQNSGCWSGGGQAGVLSGAEGGVAAGPLAEYISTMSHPLHAAGGIRHFLWEVDQDGCTASHPQQQQQAPGASGGSNSSSTAQLPAIGAAAAAGTAANPSPVLGKLDICWSGLNGEMGRLQTQPVLCPLPGPREMLLTLECVRVLRDGGAWERPSGDGGSGIGGPWRVVLEQPFQVVLKVAVNRRHTHGDVGGEKPRAGRRSSGEGQAVGADAAIGPLVLVYSELVTGPVAGQHRRLGRSSEASSRVQEEEVAGPGIVVIGSRRASLGSLSAGQSVHVVFDCLALMGGWQQLPPIVLVSEKDGKALDSVHDVQILVGP